MNYDAETWDDHDEDCHGTYDSFEDDADYQQGFIWTCCDAAGDDKGCMITNHKASVNIPRKEPVPSLSSGDKRKAEEQKMRPARKYLKACFG